MTTGRFDFEAVFCAMAKLLRRSRGWKRSHGPRKTGIFDWLKNTHCLMRCQLPPGANSKKIRIPVIIGPTAAGKTRLAVSIAHTLGLDIVSCDSRQIYKYMDIGTAKPSPGELAIVKHWMVDIVDPSQRYSAFAFASDASRIIRQCAASGRNVMVCGGSGLYFHALASGIGPQVAADPEIRRRYTDLASVEGREAVWLRLKAVDPATALSSHVSNLARNIRALEVFETMGAPLSELKTHALPPKDFEFSIVVPTLPRHALYDRINHRVEDMVRQGLWDEFQSLRARGFDRQSPGLGCLGYKELFDVEEKAVDLPGAIGRIQQNTRHYAKRQLTWLRHQVAGTAVDLTDKDAQRKVLAHVSEFLKS
jgi:tRNA dimethylallyltransferase